MIFMILKLPSCGTQLLSHAAISHHILVTFMKNVSDNKLLSVGMDTKYDNFDLSILTNITCIVVHYTLL